MNAMLCSYVAVLFFFNNYFFFPNVFNIHYDLKKKQKKIKTSHFFFSVCKLNLLSLLEITNT